MKKFEEELKDNNLEILVSNTGSSLYGQSYLNYEAVVELSEGWVSPEDHQQVAKALVNTTDKLNCAEERVGLLEKTVDQLKSQLEKQQPEIPEFVAKAVEEFKKQPDSYKGFLNDNKVCTWLNEYQMNNDDFGICGLNNKFFVLAHFAINGYTVAKEKRFYLKNKFTGNYLSSVPESNNFYHIMIRDPNVNGLVRSFTQQEIDSMAADSYEQIEVEE